MNGPLTNADLQAIESSCVHPNEFKAVVDFYLEKEAKAAEAWTDQYSGAISTIPFLRKPEQKAFIETYTFPDMIDRSFQAKTHLDKSIIMESAQAKAYKDFFILTQQEVDDLVIHKKAYDATLAVRMMKDFETTGDKTNVVCYIDHSERREYNWLLKNQKLVKGLLRDYYASDLYNL